MPAEVHYSLGMDKYIDLKCSKKKAQHEKEQAQPASFINSSIAIDRYINLKVTAKKHHQKRTEKQSVAADSVTKKLATPIPFTTSSFSIGSHMTL
ncbi:hypothetical protein HDU98_004827 [Podochytrium sp. JEL0797]|nr:hypothetical protein HDU98_004827 [Podochytrium sp. JEL0797]